MKASERFLLYAVAYGLLMESAFRRLQTKMVVPDWLFLLSAVGALVVTPIVIYYFVRFLMAVAGEKG